MSDKVRIQADDFDVGIELKYLREQSREVGAVASFIGIVSAQNEGDTVTALELEHYPGMTEKSIAAIIEQAEQRWPLLGARVIHRIGRLDIGSQIVFVGVSSRHRDAAFAACDMIMDYLKTQAPFWKKEFTAVGESRWLDARTSDSAALERWRR
ncbi:MAG TPA: molybdopterin synthase catalytic subunit MoaE [Spongiibacteraceae bacterium]|nr:molybdopterin synthase catalytic subunit MoaE [Spongiibacteraceae bacterium]